MATGCAESALEMIEQHPVAEVEDEDLFRAFVRILKGSVHGVVASQASIGTFDAARIAFDSADETFAHLTGQRPQRARMVQQPLAQAAAPSHPQPMHRGFAPSVPSAPHTQQGGEAITTNVQGLGAFTTTVQTVEPPQGQ